MQDQARHLVRMAEPLRMSGYSDARPADRWWWKFDLPPGWQSYTDASLMSVCAFLAAEAKGVDCEYIRSDWDEGRRRPGSEHFTIIRVIDSGGSPRTAPPRTPTSGP